MDKKLEQLQSFIDVTTVATKSPYRNPFVMSEEAKQRHESVCKFYGSASIRGILSSLLARHYGKTEDTEHLIVNSEPPFIVLHNYKRPLLQIATATVRKKTIFTRFTAWLASGVSSLLSSLKASYRTRRAKKLFLKSQRRK